MSSIMSGSDWPGADGRFKGPPSSQLKISHDLQPVINYKFILYSVSRRQRDVRKHIHIPHRKETSNMTSLSELFLLPMER